MKPDEVENSLNNIIDGHQEEIVAAIAVIEANALTAIDTIDVKANGDIAAPSRSLPQAKAASKLITGDLSRRFQKQFNKVVKDLSKVDKIVLSVYDTKFNQTNANAVVAASKVVFDDYNSISVDTSRRLNKAIIDFSVAGLVRDELKQEVQGILTGHDDVRGVPMAVRAEQFTQDSIMRYHNTANLAIAKQVGVKDFSYYGNVMASTRPFCVRQVGKVRTIDEWEEIGKNQDWKGKASSNIMVDVGGYNCRHFMAADL